MEDKKILKLLDDFAKICKEKNYSGLTIVQLGEGGPTKCSISANFPQTVTLLDAFFGNLQKTFGMSAVTSATYLALVNAIYEIDPNHPDTLEDTSLEVLEKAFAAIRETVLAQLTEVLSKKALKNSPPSSTLH
ncbi:MAG: hypothetical protein IJT73_10715 [Selenomonadaceae bacterium]|nr:hypothetical protein [Selenomonadaceae bacterium]